MFVSLSKLGLGLKITSPAYGACNMEYKRTNEDTTQSLIARSDACHFPAALLLHTFREVERSEGYYEVLRARISAPIFTIYTDQ